MTENHDQLQNYGELTISPPESLSIPELWGAYYLTLNQETSTFTIAFCICTALSFLDNHETVAAKVIGIHHIPGIDNVADLLTKATDGSTFYHHVKSILKPFGSRIS